MTSPASAGRTGVVDVVVPVYEAAADLARCLQSVLKQTDLGRHRLLVVLDGAQSGDVEGLVAPLEGRPSGELVVLRQPQRRGFAAAANRGIGASPDRDVVLLNSDTQVTAGWVEKLQAAAASAPEVGTVTPFSNHATICSLPRSLVENTVPAGYTVDSFAALVERVSSRAYPRLPTGVGFCLYLRRQMLATVGVLDEGFGLGYGEETDLCVRGTEAGFLHLLDDATYVWHRGQGSFGLEWASRVAQATRRMRRRHPGYLPAVAEHIRRDALHPVRQRVLDAIAPPRRPPRPAGPQRVVHLVHGWPPFNTAGTEEYARSLVRRQAGHRSVAVYARVALPGRRSGDAVEHHDHGARVRLLVNHFDQRNPLARNALHSASAWRDFRRFLREERPELVHVHHLAGHAATLAHAAARMRVPIVYQLQDWWPLCARVNLLHREGHLCPGPGLGRCSACAPLTALPGAWSWNRLLHWLRRHWMGGGLARADVLLGGSKYLASSYERLDALPRGRHVRTIPYGVETSGLAAVAATRGSQVPSLPIRCGFIGSLLPHKGAHVAVAAFAELRPEEATLEVWGDPAADPGYAQGLRDLAGPAVRFRGRFAETDKPSVLAALDLLLVPSLGLESFGLVAREAMAAGVPVVASDRGALGELFEGSGGGTLVSADDPAALAAVLRGVIAEPGRLLAWRQALALGKDMDRHAEEIEAVYEEVLAARWNGR